jgi:hypothetical protein
MIVRPITDEQAHTFAQALIAAGWLNDDPNCVDALQRLLGVFAASCEPDTTASSTTAFSCTECCAKSGHPHADGCSLKDSK